MSQTLHSEVTPNLQEINRALNLIGSAGLIEVRYKSESGVNGFGSDDKALLAQRAFECSSSPSTTAVWLTVQEISKPENLTKAENILRLRWLVVDVDPPRPNDTSSSESEKKAALNIASEIRTLLGIRTLLIGSGNGYHIYIPTDVPNTPEVHSTNRQILDTLIKS